MAPTVQIDADMGFFGKLTLLPLIARAVVLALRDFPQMNARFDDDAGVVTRHGAVHLGMLGHLAYFVVMALLGVTFAARRLRVLLLR